MTAVLPAAKDVRDLLENLLGRSVETAPGQPVPVTVADPAVVGVFTDDAKRISAVIVIDVPLAAACGAALALLPPAQAKQATEAKALTAALEENIEEVLNVAAAIFGTGGGSHVRLCTVHQAEQALPADVASLASTFGNRLDVAVTVGGYGAGALSIVPAV